MDAVAQGAAPERWSLEQVEAIAPSPAAMTAAAPLATTSRWRSTGADDDAVWGVFQGSGAEPYHTVVDHRAVATRCSCPSRRRPCKHALALLLMWVRGAIAPGAPPATVRRVVAARTGQRASAASDVVASHRDGSDGGGRDRHHDDGLPTSPDRADDAVDEDGAEAPPSRDEVDRARDERVEKMYAGLGELDRWLEDRIRTGLADPSMARYATWDELAARLVDAKAGSLANRVRRLAGLVGAHPRWHDDVLAELGLLHLLASSGRRLGELPGPLADAVATTIGWQVRTADVLAGVPDTDDWIVAGRSDTREDRIEVRRWWLWGRATRRWALVLSFAAYRQSLDDSLEVGTELRADLHRYPGGALRALVGRRLGEPRRDEHGCNGNQHDGKHHDGKHHDDGLNRTAAPDALSVSDALATVGAQLVDQPWVDRLAVTMRAAPARRGADWWLSDVAGSVRVAPQATQPGPRGGSSSWSAVLAVSAGAAVDLTVEWTPHGVIPLTVHHDGMACDVGPRADESFVAAS